MPPPPWNPSSGLACATAHSDSSFSTSGSAVVKLSVDYVYHPVAKAQEVQILQSSTPQHILRSYHTQAALRIIGTPRNPFGDVR